VAIHSGRGVCRDGLRLSRWRGPLPDGNVLPRKCRMNQKFWGLGWGPCVPWFPWPFTPWPFTPGAACVAMVSNFRDGGAFFLTGTSFPGNTG